MADDVFKWATEGDDLHLLAGTIFDLSTILLFVSGSNGSTTPWSTLRAVPSGITVSFDTVFKPFTKAVHGLTVDDQTGIVDSNTSPPVTNFILKANITGVAQTPFLRLRVRLHGKVLQVQLTPPTLHIPQAAKARFSALATFADGTAGDVSRHPGLTWNLTSGTASDVTLDASGTITAVSSGTTAEVQVTLPATLVAAGDTAASGTGSVATSAGWARDVQVEFVAGAGDTKYPTVRNILFIPDGFSDSGRADFDRAVSSVSNFMLHDDTPRPMNLFLQNGAMNIFKAWIPSPESGGMILNGLRPAVANSTTDPQFLRIEVPQEPDASQAHRLDSLQHLLYQVGLPTFQDSLGTDFNAQLSTWQTLYGAQIDPVSLPSLTGLWNSWKQRFPEVLTAERDTALGLAVGRRPQVTALRDRTLGWHPFRAQRSDLDLLLARLFLQSEAGNPLSSRIGRIWVTGGKDATLIFALVNAVEGEGTRLGDLVTASLNNTDTIVLDQRPALGNTIRSTVQPTPFASPTDDLPISIKAVIPHELGHAFNLGDEYAEIARDLPAAQPFSGKWNLLRDQEVLVPDPSNPGNQILSAAGVRWDIRWKRIRAAGVLQEMPTVVQGSPNTFHFLLRPGHGAAFKDVEVNAVIRLRRRPLVGDGAESPAMTLNAVVTTGADPAADVVLASGGANVLAYVNQLASDGETPDEVVVFASTLQNGNELGIMHSQIGAQISSTHAPLNRTVGAACSLVTDPVQIPVNLPASLLPKRYHTRIIGLYDGGDGYGCKVYHPQGICMMRAQYTIRFEDAGILLVEDPKKRRHSYAKFCHVCRYILVDQIDPTQHGAIDQEYELQYPVFP